MTVNNKLEMTLNEAVVALFEILFLNLFGRTEKGNGESQVSYAAFEFN
jgi:hypothetical protein